jgi:3'-phosphoadenosine 5'-phosphosulfate sulfotransferase (PAPS reductase)/FAD synthetase
MIRENLLKDTVGIIEDQLSKSERPALACSFGKDSIVMLFLVLQFKPDIPVIYLKGLTHPTKHNFVKRITRELGLNLVIPEPKFKDLLAKGDHVELIEIYELAPGKLLYFPIESEPYYIPNALSHCIVENVMEPTIATPLNFDSLFIGHRGDDTDPTHGDMPLKDYVVDTGGFNVIYPLRDWAEEDIWEFSKDNLIPQNIERYTGDMRSNNDYFTACFECLKPGVSDMVVCPKLGTSIPRVGNNLMLEERREYYNSSFINIDRGREQ